MFTWRFLVLGCFVGMVAWSAEACWSGRRSPLNLSGIQADIPGEAVITTDEHGPSVDTLVAGENVRMLIDTGGDLSQVPLAVGNRLPLITQGSASDANGQFTSRTVGPTPIRIGTAIATRIEFTSRGEYLAEHAGGVIWNTDMPTLGINVLSHFRVLITGEKLSLSQEHGVEGSGWMPSTGFWGSSHLVVPATVNGRDIRVLIDTGLSFSRCIKTLASDDGSVSLVIGAQCFVLAPQLVEGESEKQFTMQRPDGTLDTIITHATVGWDFLRHCRLEISYRYHQLRLSPDATLRR